MKETYFDPGFGKEALMATDIMSRALDETEAKIKKGDLRVTNEKQMFLETDCINDYQLNVKSRLRELIGPLAYDMTETPFARGMTVFIDPEDNVTKVRGSVSVRSIDASQSADACCFDLPTLQACKTKSVVETVCARYCRNLNREMDEDYIRHEANGLVGRLIGRGVTDREANLWLLRIYQVLKMGLHIVNGTLAPTSTDYKTFEGVAEVTSQANGVAHFQSSADLINDLKLIICRTSLISSQFTTDWRIAMSPLAYSAYKNAIMTYQVNNVLPASIRVDANNDWSLEGISVIVDNTLVTSDESGVLTSDVLIYDRYQIGAITLRPLTDPQIFATTKETNEVADDCGEVCDVARNRGAVAMGDTAGAFVIENVRISENGQCTSASIQGLGNIINRGQVFPVVG